MKFLNVLGIAVLAAATCSGFASCSNDNDDEPGSESGGLNGGYKQELATPQYEADAARYVFTGSSAPFKSVELTSAGRYIVYLGQDANQSAPRKGMFNRAGVMSRSYSNGIIEGTFTKVGEGIYDLHGFGTIAIDMDDNGTVADLDMRLDNGSTYSLTAQRHNQLPESVMTNNLCRSWEITTLRYYIKLNGRTMFDKTVSIDNIKELIEALYEAANRWDDEDEYDFDYPDYFNDTYTPRHVTFTKAGTYMVEYKNSSLAISTWSWIDQDNGHARYSWDYDNMDSYWDSGDMYINFPGNDIMTVTEGEFEYDEDDHCSYESAAVWTMIQR